MHKLFAVMRNGRFYHSRFERRQYFLLPSAAFYLRMLCRRFFEPEHPITVTHAHIPHTQPAWCRLMWLGHATFLIQLGGSGRQPVTLLTDPIFGNATPFFRRTCPPGLAISELPPIDYILISHNHRDHMDESTLMQLFKRNEHVICLVPHGDRSWFIQRGFLQVHEHYWWQSLSSGALTCTFLPARHWSGRWIGDRNRSLWGSWHIGWGGRSLYFAGDTAYWKHFSCIQAHMPSIDVALLPIGPCEPRGYMQHHHMSDSWVIRAFLELGAKHLVPMHWGTFRLGIDAAHLPLERLISAWQRAGDAVGDKQLSLINHGQEIAFADNQEPAETSEIVTL